ncbi:MAG: efflux RND transporter permease subunit [Methylococcaceae bacterium]
MNLSRPFIRRPVATTLLMTALLLVGVLAYRILPVSALPQVDYPTLQLLTFYPGASPDVMATTVTTPLERQLGQIAGLTEMSSTSSAGVSVIVLRFKLGLELDIAEQEVQAAITATQALLPNELPSPPIYNKVNPADAPILSLALLSSNQPLTAAQKLADTRLVQKLSRIPGVGLVKLSGGQRPAIRVKANPGVLAAYRLSLEDVRGSIVAASVKQPKGSVETATRTATLNANDQLEHADEFAQIVVAWRDGRPVRLADVATVVEDVENPDLAAWANRSPALLIDIQRQPGSNVIEVVDRINRLLPELRTELPASFELITLTDRTHSIRASIRAVQGELAVSIALVILVIFIFLRNIRATSIPVVVVPLSLVGTFAAMYLAGFSINNLTLMALTVATGFVVDDAIVVIENIARHIEQGETPLEAALRGSKQIGFTIISLTLSLVAVLIPLLFMGDVVGQLFREFAVTLAVAILISALISLTLTPMMCARILSGEGMSRQNRLFEGMIAGYAWLLDRVLNHRRLTLMVAVLTLMLTILTYWSAPKGFFPVQDTGLIQVTTTAPTGISFEAMSQRQQQVVEFILKEPSVENVTSFVGVDGVNDTLNQARVLITLKPHGERTASLEAIRIRLKQTLAERLPAMRVDLQAVQDLSLETRKSRSRYRFTLSTAQTGELALWTQKLLERLETRPELRDVASNLDDSGREAYIDIDRTAAARLGVSVAAINNTLYDAYGHRLIATLYTQSSQYRVVLEAGIQSDLNGPLRLAELRIPSSLGTQVPLTSMARLSERSAAGSIHHLAQFPSATVSFDLAQGYTLEDAINLIEHTATDLGMPASVRTEFHGTAQAFQESLSNTVWLILAAIITVYIVLGVLYESFIHPLTILSTLPSAGLGALLALRLANTELGIVAVIGIILLIGIVKKNAIMMIDFALEAERSQKLQPEAAIRAACLLRFRPILMTTLAALLGALPLMLGTGAGSELRHPLGLTLVGGLLLSQLLTLFTTPVIYLSFSRLEHRKGR